MTDERSDYHNAGGRVSRSEITQMKQQMSEVHRVVVGTSEQHYRDGLASLVNGLVSRVTTLETHTEQERQARKRETEKREAEREQESKERDQEKKESETWMRRLVIGSVVTTLIGLMVGYLFAHFAG